MSVANILTSDKELTSLPSVKTEVLTLRGTLGNAVFTTNSTGTQAFINGAVIETGGIPVWVGNAQTDLDMEGYNITDINTATANTLVLKDGAGIAVIKYDQPTNDLQIGSDVYVDGDMDATALLISDQTTTASKATMVYSDATQTVTLDKKFEADEVIAPTVTLTDGATSASLTYVSADNEIQASGSTALFGQNLRALGELQLGDLANIATISHLLPADVVHIDHPLTVDGNITATGTITANTITGTNAVIGGAITGSSLDVGGGSVTCGQLNWQTLNPPLPPTWVPTATSALNMDGYNVTTTVGELTMVNPTNAVNIDGTVARVKVGGSSVLIASGTEITANKPINAGANSITTTGTVNASLADVTTARATNMRVVDAGNQVVEIKKNSGVAYPVYTNTALSSATASLLDDVNNKPTLSYNSTTDVLSLNAKDVAGNPVVLSTVDITGSLQNYVPIAGNFGNPMTGALYVDESVSIQSKNVSAGLITAIPPLGFISIEDPLQTYELGIRADGGAGTDARLLFGANESAPPSQQGIISYNYVVDDSIKMNKPLRMSSKDVYEVGAVSAQNVTATSAVSANSVSANTAITAGTTVVATGSITSTTGNISATAGDITAGGNISTSTGIVSGGTITALGGGLKSYAGLNLNPSGVPSSESSITGANNITAVGTISTTGAMNGGAITGSSLSAGSGTISTTGTINGGAITGTSLSAGSGTISTTGAINGGAITGTSLSAGSGTISTTGAINGGAITGTSLSAGSGAVTGGTLNIASGEISGDTNGLIITGSGQGITALSTSNGAMAVNGRLNVSGSSSSIAINVNTLIPASNTIEVNGGTFSTNGASGLKITPTTISSTSNNVAMTGINSITMAGTTPSISGANSVSITNTNATTPLTITNTGDNPHVIMTSAGSDLVPVEFTLQNGAIIDAIGNQRSASRGMFFFVNGADALQISNVNRRMVANYSPSSPCFATSGVNGAWVAGTTGVPFTSGVPYLIGTETIVLSTNNFPIPVFGGATQAYMGLQGTVSYKLNNNHEITTSVFVSRIRGGVTLPPVLLYGAGYTQQTTNSGYMTQIVNGISYNEAIPASSILFQIGDTVIFTVYATYSGGSPPTMTVAPIGMSSVISPVFF